MRPRCSDIDMIGAVRAASAAIVVFLASAAVLVLEILAAREMAPYVGVSLNTYTGIIGTVLAGIAAGTWIGGWAADRISPNKLLGPIMIASGLLVITSPPLVTGIGQDLHADSLKAIVALSATTVFLPAFVLSGVTPIVAKMQLRDLHVTGSVVGRLSAFATAGALVGTFGTGFVLTAHLHTRVILAGVGIVLVVAGAVLWWRLLRSARALPIVLLAAAVGASVAALEVRGPCKVESGYFCIRVLSISGNVRILMLDNVEHSIVNLRNPKVLAVAYLEVMAAATQTIVAPGKPIAALNIGGGAFTLPRYFAATRSGSTNTVIEIDPAVVDIARSDFGLRSEPRLRTEIGDARVLVTREPPRSYDVIVGDAFSGRSPPWHLTTKQFLAQLQMLLKPRGLYLMNLIDAGDRFLRAEAATMRQVFPHVVLFEMPSEPHNHVLAGSTAPLDVRAIAARSARLGSRAMPVTGAGLQRLIGHATPLDDDFAPVDQLLT
jgi:spermidine synthase